MLISKHFDPVLGIDIHILAIPPAGPIPIPHPHIALIFDVIDYVPILGATVKVGGLPRSTAGTAGRPIPHIPMGGPFVKPPMNEDEIFMGSLTVLADGGPLSYTALPTLSCHDIGLIAPPRKKKPKKSFGMVLPTSVVIAIPLGMPVMVGGGPTIDMMGLAMMGGFAALGGAFKKLRKMQKKSKRIKKMSDAIHKRAKKAMDKLGVPPNVRNKVHKGICTVTGHPVDVATGKMFTDHIDFSLPGPLPLVWERTWYSTSVYDGPLGHGWHHNYDLKLCEMDNAVAVRLADGRSVAFPALDINETCFDRQERMTLFRDEDGYALDTKDKQRYRFAPFNGQQDNQLLTSLSQTTSGAAIKFYYNDKGQLHQIIDSGGRLIQLSYTDGNRIHKIFLPEPESNVTRDHATPTLFCAVEHHYRDGMLVQVDDALQQPLQYHYDHKLLIKETFRSGLSFYFEYDGLDHNARCLRTWGDEGIYYREIRYDLENNITYVKNSLGHITTYYHNGVLPYRIVDSLNHASLVEYNEYSQVVCETNELGYKTRYEYDGFGNTIKAIGAEGHAIQLIFDSNQNLIETIDQIGCSWRYTYDDTNRIKTKIDPLGAVTSYVYDEGMLSAINDANGNKLFFFYDHNLNLRSLGDGNNEQLLLEYDALGNLLVSNDNSGNRRKLFFDRLSRVQKIEEPDGNVRSFTYGQGNNIVHAKDDQQEVFFAYSGTGRVVSRAQAGKTIRFEYDTEDQLRRIFNENGHAYHFERNARNEIISESGFDGLMRQFIIDPAGRIVRTNRPEQRYSTYTYNPNNQLTQVLHSDGTSKKFAYRENGDLIQATNDSRVLKWELDAFGRPIKEFQDEYWISSEYDALGNRTRIKTSQGLNQRIDRNKRGDVLGIKEENTHFEIAFKRDSRGLEIQRNLTGGIQSHTTRDKLGRPVYQEIIQGKKIHSSKHYIWGVNNRLLKLIDGLHRETIFQHDALGNLFSARYSDESFDLRIPDSIGNLFKTHSHKDREYGPAGQLLAVHTTKGTTRYHYDSEGNLISKLEQGNKRWRYQWDGNGWLVKVIRPDNAEVTFAYDALGRRIRKIFNNKITHWIWDDNNPLHEWVETAATSTSPPQFAQQLSLAEDIRADFHKQFLQPIEPQAPPAYQEGSVDRPICWLFEPDSFSPMAKLVGDEHYSIINDHLGTPAVIFDNCGQQVWSAEINIWGALRQIQGHGSFCPFRFPGQYEDSETGLYYNRFRYYDPVDGQYISQDPIRLAGGMQVYGYVNDPTIYIDPLGLSGKKNSGDCGTSNKRIGDVDTDELESIGSLNAKKAGGTERLPSVLYSGGRTTLFHYTSEENLGKILTSKTLFNSKGFEHARHGDGQYLADISPDSIVGLTKQDLTQEQIKAGQLSLGQLSSLFYNRGNMGNKISHFVEIDVSDLVVRQGVTTQGNQLRKGVQFILNDDNLDLTDRIVRSGKVLD
ncbi:MAG: hypothetical protein B0W54_18740 [Cellvibrio sp. 79]|nr:MAG: hypothetical protein B0W54_18740 [Cellvibrio sp. 79]